MSTSGYYLAMKHEHKSSASRSLRAWQASQGLSFSAVGLRLGVSGVMAGYLIKGDRRPSLALANRIAEVAGINQSDWDIPIRL